MAVFVSGNSVINGTASDDIILDSSGGGNTFNGFGGNDVIYGDHDQSFVDIGAGNGTFATAIDISDSSSWSMYENPDVGNTSIPYTTVIATGANEFDWFEVTIGAGESITVDVDYGEGVGFPLGGPGEDMVIRLFASDGTSQVALGDDSPTTNGGGGSITFSDPYLTYTALTGGTYYIKASRFADNPVTTGVTYMLNISVTNHANTNVVTSGNDTINGGDGNDRLLGLSGDDTINGGNDDDTIEGGSGEDVLRGQSGSDSLSGGSGDDILFVDANDTFVDGGADYDRLFAAVGSLGLLVNLAPSNIEYAQGGNWNDYFDAVDVGEAVKLWGHGRSDTLIGSAFADYLDGGSGDDNLFGNAGADILDGSTGSDLFFAGAGNDIMYIDADDSIINGGADYDRIYVRGYSAGVNVDMTAGELEFANGNAQNDTFNATSATWSVKLFGQGGNDTLTGGDIGDQLYGSNGMDIINGNGGNDIISGGAGIDQLFGGAGDDILFVDSDDTVINGGADYDRVYVTSGSAGVTILMAAAGIEFAYGAAGNDFFNAVGSVAAVKLQGRGGNDSLVGGNLADLIYGGSGADLIQGLGGNDFLSGGGADGAIDTFFFLIAGWGDDTISDFQNNQDLLNLSSLGTNFAALTITALGANNTVVSFGGDSITLLGMQLADVDASDFVFV